MPRPLKPHQKAMLDAFAAGESPDSIAARTGYTRSTIYHLARTNGIQRRRSNHEAMLADFDAGMSPKDIAAAHGYTKGGVYALLARNGRKPRYIMPPGHRGRPRDQDRERRAIEMREAGARLGAIGSALNISRQRVHQILKRAKVQPTTSATL